VGSSDSDSSSSDADSDSDSDVDSETAAIAGVTLQAAAIVADDSDSFCLSFHRKEH